MNRNRLYAFILVLLAGLGGVVSQRVFAEEATSDDMCAEHNVEEEDCPFCRPDLIKSLGFCSGHGVPEALCTQCRPALVEAFKAEGDWCAGHGVPESQCEACNPGAKKQWQQDEAVSDTHDSDRLWCRAHGIYEDECLICHPELKQNSAKTGPLELMCNEHRVLERECGICHPELAPALEVGQSLKVRMESPEAARKAGIRTAPPKPSHSSPSVKVLGVTRYNQNRLAHITPLAPGVVQRVLVDVGRQVVAGEALVEIASSEVAAAKRDYVIATVDERVKALAHERENRLSEKKLSTEENFQQAESEHELARIIRLTAHQRLTNLGFTEDEIKRVENTKSSSSLLIVRAPYDGTLIERTAVIGEAVQPGRTLFTLAALSTMWIELAIPESEVARIKTGLPVRVTFQGLTGVEVEGELFWVHSRVDERTRLIKARAEVQNPDGRLRDGMFCEVRVVLGENVSTLRVPNESLQRIEQQPYVFVKAAGNLFGEDLFELRRVTIGERNGHTAEIISGIQPNDEVVVEGAFTMKSEFLKSRLGAGCVDE